MRKECDSFFSKGKKAIPNEENALICSADNLFLRNFNIRPVRNGIIIWGNYFYFYIEILTC